MSRSGFYKWRAAYAAGPSPAQQRREVIDAKVEEFHDGSDQVCGSPRLLADLHDEGVVISRKTVAASMRRQQPAGISPRQFTPVTNELISCKSIKGIGSAMTVRFEAHGDDTTLLHFDIEYDAGRGLAGRALGTFIDTFIGTALRHIDQQLHLQIEAAYVANQQL